MAMGEVRLEPSEGSTCSEEKTEPFSQSEFEARIQSFRAQAASSAETHLKNTAVHLDELVVPPDQGIRILMRPLTRSHSVGAADNCQWLALRAEVASPDQPHQMVLAVTQTARDIKFVVNIPCEQRDESLWCDLYYDPTSDNQILVNNSDIPIALTRLSQRPVEGPGLEYLVNPGASKALIPGTWRIKVKQTEVLDFRILERRPVTFKLPFSLEDTPPSVGGTSCSTGKRPFSPDADDALGPDKRMKSGDGEGKEKEGCIMFLGPATGPLVLPLPNAAKGKEIATANGHPLLDMKKDEIVEIHGPCEMDEYELVKREPIASSSLSSVFTATADHPKIPSNEVITVKVLKTRATSSVNGALVPPQQAERNVIRQADIWLREYQAQNNLSHNSIVRLYAGDARHLSLYMEHIEAHDLSYRGMWRHRSTELFAGTRDDAVHILRDISGALAYIHARGLVHNDIKPGNILFSRDRGAVLCDFGLSTRTDHKTTPAGTPYYIPPEFIGRSLRGPPGDVWAFGVTMLYVLRKIVFPDSRQRPDRPKQLYWQIAEVNRAPPPRSRTAPASAIMQMQQWLTEVHEARSKLNVRTGLEHLVWAMLEPQPGKRITMERVLKEVLEGRAN